MYQSVNQRMEKWFSPSNKLEGSHNIENERRDEMERVENVVGSTSGRTLKRLQNMREERGVLQTH